MQLLIRVGPGCVAPTRALASPAALPKLSRQKTGGAPPLRLVSEGARAWTYLTIQAHNTPTSDVPSRSSALRQILRHELPPKQWRVTNETFSFEISPSNVRDSTTPRPGIRTLLAPVGDAHRSPAPGGPRTAGAHRRAAPTDGPSRATPPPVTDRRIKPLCDVSNFRDSSGTCRTRTRKCAAHQGSSIRPCCARSVRRPATPPCTPATTGLRSNRVDDWVGIAAEASDVSELHVNPSEMARVWISCTERWRIRRSPGPTDAPRSGMQL